MDEKLRVQIDGTQKFEKELVTKKEKTAALEARIAALEAHLRKKKKKMSSYKASNVELKKKLNAAKLLVRSTLARAKAVEQEKKLEAIVKEAMIRPVGEQWRCTRILTLSKMKCPKLPWTYISLALMNARLRPPNFSMTWT